MKKIYTLLILSLLSSPLFALAQATIPYFVGVAGWVSAIRAIVGWLIPIAFGLCLLAFFWGVAIFIFRAGEDEGAWESGRRIMIAGIVGLFVVSAIWSIVYFIGANILTGTPVINPQPVPTIVG